MKMTMDLSSSIQHHNTLNHNLFFLTIFAFLSIVHAQATDDSCKGSAKYELTFNIFFTPSSDPLIPPSDTAQIPIIVAVIHSSDIQLFRLSDRLNDSVAEVASKATASDLSTVLDDLQLSKKVSSYVILEGREDAATIPIDGSVKLTLRAKGILNRLSVMVHLSPSPAWFSGVDAFKLCGGNNSTEFGAGNITLGNFDAGLDKGLSFEADPDPYDQGETVPVSIVDVLDDVKLVDIKLAILPAPKTWWKIVVGVLVPIFVLVALAVIIVPRLIKGRGKEAVPLTKPQNVEW